MILTSEIVLSQDTTAEQVMACDKSIFAAHSVYTLVSNLQQWR